MQHEADEKELDLALEQMQAWEIDERNSDPNDPVVDTARAILDGHILLSRQQAQMGIYPAIDVPLSVSRVMNDIVDGSQIEAAQKFRRLVSLYLENRDLILMGGYTPGYSRP